jgi:hypothetical protein
VAGGAGVARRCVPEQVLEALGWEFAELRFALGRWATKLREQNRITDGQSAALLTIMHGDR